MKVYLTNPADGHETRYAFKRADGTIRIGRFTKVTLAPSGDMFTIPTSVAVYQRAKSVRDLLRS